MTVINVFNNKKYVKILEHKLTDETRNIYKTLKSGFVNYRFNKMSAKNNLLFLYKNLNMVTLGTYRVTSEIRSGVNQSYHGTGEAIDIVFDDPVERLLNGIIYDYIWPGGFGVDKTHGNIHFHLDLGPKRRWLESNGKTVGELHFTDILSASIF